MTTINRNDSDSNASDSNDNDSDSVSSAITCQRIADASRMQHTDTLFGLHFPMRLEPTIFDMAGRLALEYRGGYWEFNALSNGGFYMSPRSTAVFDVSSENGFEGQLSADALGITACLHAYSHLSFSDGEFAETCADQFHLLREYALGHEEVRSILQAID